MGKRDEWIGLPVDELERIWERKRLEVADSHDFAAVEELFMLRREIDKRRGRNEHPPIEVNFEQDYITD